MKHRQDPHLADKNHSRHVINVYVKSTGDTRLQYMREDSLRRNHHLSIEQYIVLWEAQGGVCKICRRPETSRDRYGNLKNLSVDHDHECCPSIPACGECVRGLLCQRCNQKLGVVEDVEWMALAMSYLENRPL